MSRSKDRVKYTSFKLTDPQLRRLSQMSHGRPHGHGVALQALLRKGLVDRHGSLDHEFGEDYSINQAGFDALIDARWEGW